MLFREIISRNNSCLFLQLYRTYNALNSSLHLVIYESIRREIPEGIDLQQLSCDRFTPPTKDFYCGGYSVLCKGDRWGAGCKSLGFAQNPWMFFEKDICKITANARFTILIFSRKLLANRKLLKLNLSN